MPERHGGGGGGVPGLSAGLGVGVVGVGVGLVSACPALPPLPHLQPGSGPTLSQGLWISSPPLLDRPRISHAYSYKKDVFYQTVLLSHKLSGSFLTITFDRPVTNLT